MHQFHEMELKDTYSLNHLREIISKIKPDVILAELWPSGREIPDFKVEHLEVILPLKEVLGYEVIKVDYGSKLLIDKFDKQNENMKNLVKYGDLKEKIYIDVVNTIFDDILKHFKTPKELNSDACTDILRSVKDMEFSWFFKNSSEESLWEKHNEINYEKIMEEIRKSDKEKFLITFGMQHKYYFEDRLKEEKDIVFVPVTEYLD